MSYSWGKKLLRGLFNKLFFFSLKTERKYTSYFVGFSVHPIPWHLFKANPWFRVVLIFFPIILQLCLVFVHHFKSLSFPLNVQCYCLTHQASWLIFLIISLPFQLKLDNIWDLLQSNGGEQVKIWGKQD